MRNRFFTLQYAFPILLSVNFKWKRVMKTLLFILCLGSSISIQANTMNRFEGEENVEESHDWENGSNRSLSQHIFIRTEGNLLLLSTDKQIDDFR